MYLKQDKIDSIVTLLEGMISSIEKFQDTSSCAAPTVNAQLLSTVATGRTVVSNIQNFYLEELYLLHQISNVHGFYQQFGAIRTHVLSMQLELLEEFFTSLFTNELHKDDQTYVQGFCPCTVLDAYHVVCIHEYSHRAGATPSALTVNVVLPLQFCSSDALSDVDEAANSMHPLVVCANNEHTMVDLSDGVSLVVDNAKFYEATGILSSVPAEIPTTTGKEKEPTCLEYTNRSDELLTFYKPVISVWNLVPVCFSLSKHAPAGIETLTVEQMALRILPTFHDGSNECHSGNRFVLANRNKGGTAMSCTETTTDIGSGHSLQGYYIGHEFWFLWIMCPALGLATTLPLIFSSLIYNLSQLRVYCDMTLQLGSCCQLTLGRTFLPWQ